MTSVTQMKSAFLFAGLIALGTTGCSSSSSAKPYDWHAEWGDNLLENPEFMEKMAVYMTPDAHHEVLARQVGDWNVATKMFMAPKSEAVDMQATAECRMILGGRFLFQEFHGTMMDEPFEGVLISGFNKLEQEYFSLWMDTWSTAVHQTTGAPSADGVIRMTGKMKDFLTPDGRNWRHVIREEGEGFVVQLYDSLPDGSEWLVMHMTYTRRPGV